MRSEDPTDDLLRDTLSDPVPHLSADFDATLMARLRPRRPTVLGHLVLIGYAATTLATAAWLMRHMDPLLIVLSLTVTAAAAAGASVYVRWLSAAA
jgi:hypothetical protein